MDSTSVTSSLIPKLSTPYNLQLVKIMINSFLKVKYYFSGHPPR